MRNKIKVLHVLWSGEIGGTEEYVLSLLKHFDCATYEIYACFLSRRGQIFEEARATMSNVLYMGMKNGFDMRGAFRLFKFLRKEKFDIIHSHSTNILTNAVISLFRTPKKIFSEHVSPGAKDAFKKRSFFYTCFSNVYQRIIAISETVKQKIVENFHVDPDVVDVIYNGVDLEKFRNSHSPLQDDIDFRKEGRYVFGYIGRMADFKRP